MMKKVLLLSLLITFPFITSGVPVINVSPIGIIEGENSLINRPEGIAFSPVGDFIAVACYRGNNVLFYSLTTSQTSMADPVPFFVLGGFNRPHDVAFSPDGSHVAVACRRQKQASFHRFDPETGLYQEEPFMVIDGRAISLKSVNAIKYSPAGDYLGICDVDKHEVVLFRCDGGECESIPSQRLSGYLLKPDGLAFTEDGRLLAVTSHGTDAVIIFERNSDLSGYNPTPVEIIQGDETLICFPHSLVFHPEDDSLFVSCAGGRNNLLVFRKESDTPPYYSSTPSQSLPIFNPDTIHRQEQYPEEGGVKGIAISPDGRTLGVCSSDIGSSNRSILFFEIESQ